MILTGQAKKDFELWLLKEGNEIIKNGTIEYDLYYMCKYMIPQNMVNSKIIDFFDGVGIYVNVYSQSSCVGTAFNFNVNEFSNYDYYPSRHEATEQAIKCANEIYNENTSNL